MAYYILEQGSFWLLPIRSRIGAFVNHKFRPLSLFAFFKSCFPCELNFHPQPGNDSSFLLEQVIWTYRHSVVNFKIFVKNRQILLSRAFNSLSPTADQFFEAFFSVKLMENRKLLRSFLANSSYSFFSKLSIFDFILFFGTVYCLLYTKVRERHLFPATWANVS